ncbi:MT-A70 family [Aspergillus mulundensis]|uniref:MT-A70-domain-containing protein n=1 Tax=Aspergillus mulundensis TaxID=1810919 RepID=A0A3D8RKW4_9EURO|nr:hypothetical protein DSM5745_07347 [Aspergillus mulundensis]RDW74685.1 hypothetical protein DSM5745_07347 [Aspergillus mulundensis]
MGTNSSILYENPSSTVFLVDIPTSIALAQDFSPQSNSGTSNNTEPDSITSLYKKTVKRRHIISSTPLKQPYAVSNEPKSETARTKVLEQTPQSEKDIHGAVCLLASNALSEIKHYYPKDSEWCLPRYLLEDEDGKESGEDSKQNEKARSKWLDEIRDGKRARGKKRRQDEHPDASDGKEQGDPQFFDIQVPSRQLSADENDQFQRQPPLILAPGRNRFEDESKICNTLVKNTSSDTTTIELRDPFAIKSLRRFSFDSKQAHKRGHVREHVFIIPPLSKFILCNLPLSDELDYANPTPIPDLDPDQKFNLIVLDPPWANRSVRRSGHYQTQTYLDNEMLMGYISSVFAAHSHPGPPPLPGDTLDRDKFKSNLSIAAIWTTNSAKSRAIAYGSLIESGFSICEEWVWIKTTVEGEPVTSIEGLWRKPYEILVIGQKGRGLASGSKDSASAGGAGVVRRVIAAVPDVHSRKPNLKELFEKVFFSSDSENGSGTEAVNGPGNKPVEYSALEVFARNLTAGWWACGNEVLKFNSESWWVEADSCRHAPVKS